MTEDNKRPTMRPIGLALDCENAQELADFYIRLLGWEQTHKGGEGWAGLGMPGMPGGQFTLAFQEVEGYQPPVWPWQPDKPGQMLHLDFLVEDLDEAVAFALGCGATLAGEQYYDTSRTMLDPAGHPFCLTLL